jgi:hypothetical protein
LLLPIGYFSLKYLAPRMLPVCTFWTTPPAVIRRHIKPRGTVIYGVYEVLKFAAFSGNADELLFGIFIHLHSPLSFLFSVRVFQKKSIVFLETGLCVS